MRTAYDAKALSGLVRNFDGGRVSLAVTAASVALGCALVGAEVAGIGGLCVTPLDLRLFVAVAVLLSACQIAMHFFRKTGLFRIPAILSVAAGIAFVLYFPVTVVSALVFTAYVAAPLSIYVPFPRGAAVSIGLLAAFLVLRFGVFSPESLGQKAASFRDVLLFAVAPLFVSVACSALSAFRAELDRLLESLETVTRLNLSYQDYNASIEEKSAFRERLRITRDIHDIVGYALTNTIMTLRAASLMCEKDPGRLRGFLDAARAGAEGAHAEVREALGDLRRMEIRSAAGPAAIARVVRSFKAATGADVRVDFGRFDWELSGEAAFAVSHFVQEGMLNAVTHGRATRISVDFAEDESGLRVSVRDNGEGVKVMREGIGISGMRERIEKLGGELGYASTADGFSIEIRLPPEGPETVLPGRAEVGP